MAKEMVFGIMRDLDAEMLTYQHREQQIALACDSLRRDEIMRICARYELESDEFFTREQKAQRIIANRSNSCL